MAEPTAPAATADPRLPARLDPRRGSGRDGALAVCLHAIAPRNFAAVRRLRAWLTERGVDQVTLAVIPAADLHPLAARSPQLVGWLRHQLALGDTVAQYGLAPRGRPEFAGLTESETRDRVLAGRGLLQEVELDPHGFIAPAYAYTPALRTVLAPRFDWFADRHRIWSTGGRVLRASARRAARPLGPTGWLVPRTAGQVLRVDLHPGDLDREAGRGALERLLERASPRQSVTYDAAISSQFANFTTG